VGIVKLEDELTRRKKSIGEEHGEGTARWFDEKTLGKRLNR
jgi:hypothetical protein